MKVLVLEDDEILLKVIKTALENENYKVDCFTNGMEALNSISNGYSCFILDINVPSLSGISVLQNIRDYIGEEVPILIISANHEFEKIKTSYEKGCSDYIKKPFFIFELIEKVKMLCTIKHSSINFSEDCRYDFIEHTLYVDNKKKILAKKEILYLELFAKNLNRIVTFEEIETYVWEGESSNINNTRALIKRIRKKLPINSINIVIGYGYALSDNCKYS